MKMSELKPIFIIVDVAFIVYWILVFGNFMPEEYLFKDYDNVIVAAWNYSFMPLDMAISATGLLAIVCYTRRDDRWRSIAIISLTLTFCSGLQAIAFWALRKDFDPAWWALNGFLMLYPLYFFVKEMFFQTTTDIFCVHKYPQQ